MKIDTLISSMEFKLPQKKPERETKKEKDFEYPLPDFQINGKIKIEKVNLEKIPINGSGSFSLGKKKRSYLKMKLNLSNAPAVLNAELLSSRKNASLDFTLNDFDLFLLENLTPENLGILKGKADLDFNGTFSYPHLKRDTLSLKVNFKANAGDYNNPYLGTNWEKFIKENPGLEKYISKNYQPYVEFEKILLDGKIDKGKIEIENFLFQAPKDKLLIHANGYIGLDEKQRSQLYVDIINKIGITLPGFKKLFGMETLYFKLV